MRNEQNSIADQCSLHYLPKETALPAKTKRPKITPPAL